MTFVLGQSSEKHLVGVAEPLVRVVRRAVQITPVDLTVSCGLRSKEDQALAVARGNSQTQNSRHLDGHAVDVVPWANGTVQWPNQVTAEGRQTCLERYWWPLAHAMFDAADELGVLIQWGNDWNEDGVPVAQDKTGTEHLADWPHWQIPWPFREQDARMAAQRRVMLRASGAAHLL